MLSLRQLYHLLGTLILFFALFSGSWFLWLLGTSFFALYAMRRWWLTKLPQLVTVSWEADQSRVMPGTPVQILLTLVNRSWLPLPLTRLQFSLPEHVHIEGADSVTVSQKRAIAELWLSVPRKSQVERSLTLIPSQRGVIWLSELQGEALDPFGGDGCPMVLPMPFSLLVYPAILPLPSFSLGETEAVGNRLSRQRTQDDPTFLRGLRPYAAGDRLRSIDWKASAKTSELQTRQYEYTARASWRIVGHILPSYEPTLMRFNDAVNERTISCLAALATRCRQEGLSYELLLNVRFRGKEHFDLPKGSGKKHYVQAMTQLARLSQYIPTSLPLLLRRLEHSREKEALLIVTPRMDDFIRESMQRLLRRGHTVLLMDVSGERPVYQQIAVASPPAGKGGVAR
ncbi:DUF58 domain-containing protein [Brevibacillus migulae]|uniref:DUF58 domain-containing protein n=1 Tax=Brevibacillus migulae TaxID=1644114 RepID=UPI001F3409BC|nr:DUF58 domain-containing protein [Brevibacillus migulae]